MTNGIVRVPLEWNVRIVSRHPRVERIVQEQVCKERADDPSLRRSRCARHDAAVLHLHRRLQPALDVEPHPHAVRMMTDRLEQQLPIDTVEVTFDVDVERPVVAPAALTSLAYGIDRRSAGPVAIRVGMEHRLQIRPQVASGDLLGDTVGDRRDAQRARATVCLRNLDPPHRRRKVAPRRQPVPELVEVVRKINLEFCNRLCVYPSRSLVRLHTFEGFPDFPLGDVERLCLDHGLLPSPVGPWPRLNNAAPSVQLHYRAFIPTASCSAPVLRFGTLVLAVCAAWTSPLASERQVLTFRTRAWLSFAPPTCRMPLGQASGFSRADPGGRVTPRFRHRLIRFRHFIGGLLALASLNLAGRDQVPTFPQRSLPSLLTTAACGGLRPAPDCRPRRALLHLSYSCAPSYLDGAFVTHAPKPTLNKPALGASATAPRKALRG